MIPQELLQKRYKVKAGWPDMTRKVGDIITIEGSQEWQDKHAAYFDTYPHLFQPLPWWADRKVEDMPRFIKVTAKYKDCFGWVIDVHNGEWRVEGNDAYALIYKIAHYERMIIDGNECTPATEQDYITFKQSI